MKALTAEQAAFYRHNGFLYPLPALSPDEIAYFLAGLDRLESELGCPVAEADIKWRSHAYAHSPWFNELVRHPKILDAIEDVIGPDILVWTSTFFIKDPGSKTFAAWHQDGAFFGLDPNEQVCAWVALTDAGRDAGCMDVLSSKGQPRMLHHEAKGLKHSINRAGQTIVEPFDKRGATAMALKAGEFSLHHEFAVHRSPPNHAPHRRIGIGLNYLPPHVRVQGPVRLKAMLVRGEDRYGYWDLIDPPTAERDPAALATHQAVSDAYRANYKIQVERHAQRFLASAD